MIIDVFSDPICPWCFIGKRRLDTALVRQGLADGAIIRWRAFQLNPGMPAEGMRRDAYLTLKFGGADRARQIYRSIAEAGAAEGIAFDFDRIARTPNTVDAHRLIRLAARSGRADAVADALFTGYFLEGRDIGDSETLVAIAASHGLDAAETRDFLASTADAMEILAEHDFAVSLNITGVPCFVFEGRYAVVGAQEADAFLPVFDLVREEARQAAGP